MGLNNIKSFNLSRKFFYAYKWLINSFQNKLIVEAIKAKSGKLKNVVDASKEDKENQHVPDPILKKNFLELETIKDEIEEIQEKSYNLRNLKKIKYRYWQTKLNYFSKLNFDFFRKSTMVIVSGPQTLENY